MENLVQINNSEIDKDIPQKKMLDESIIDELPKKNTRQGLSENTKEAYKAAIRDYNNFLAKNELYVSQESLKSYFNERKGKLSPSTLNIRKSALLKCIKAQIGENNILRYMAIEKVFQNIDSYKRDRGVSHEQCLTENKIIDMMEAAQSKKTQLLIHFLKKNGDFVI